MASILSKKKKKKKKKKNKREKYSISELKTLGHQLLSSRAHINNLPLLMSFVCSGTSPPYYALEALLSVQSFFTPILPDLPSHPQGDPQDPEFIYRTWLRSKFDDFVNSLIDIAVSPQSKEALRELVLEMGEGFTPLYTTGLFTAFYFTYITIEKLARTLGAKDISDNKIVSVDGNNKSHSRTSVELPIHKIYRILSHIPPLEGTDEKAEHEMWNGSGVFIKEGDHKEHSRYPKADDKQNKVLSAVNIAKKMKLKFTKAWISFLRLPLPVDLYKEVLVTLHQAVIPYLSNPIMLCDFLTRSYDIGGVISVMALSSLYILMTQHGLEYPNFYEKLFALLVPSIFMAKHRAKFFELLDSCLKSPLLPAYLAAAFAKKLSRLSLSVPPSGALVIIALIHNLLRRHPSINCLVHRENGDGTSRDNSRVEDGETEDSCTKPEISTEPEISSKKSGIDHFNNEESNPVKTDAMRSSLWEIDTLRHHYCPPVSRFVLSLENDLTVRSKTTEVAVKDFSSGSYATIFRAEIGRRVKQVPLAFYKATPSSLFSESDFVGWTFKYKENDELFTSGVDNKNIDISEDHGHGSAKRQRIECL
ncbi:nucleolar complex protein 4 homolog isoform X2 [Camellia sinensis]|uniref:nucleolar complex protein 4 homolog isoform X2 n=1 Tax=Camellia sinensis TaxID=4442 RepID=UPI001035BDE9|nr:nucleolar complex protein 4 homolog isoform X2 [Camellia sinensis]